MRAPYQQGDERTLAAAAAVMRCHVWLLDVRRPDALRCYTASPGEVRPFVGLTYRSAHYDRLELPPGCDLLARGADAVAQKHRKIHHKTQQDATVEEEGEFDEEEGEGEQY
eukprot:Rhum_TRINITY_DN15261_c6_g1::Rhum_TRINITY_DN15261_c6_g1_i4::g.146729::m.146729